MIVAANPGWLAVLFLWFLTGTKAVDLLLYRWTRNEAFTYPLVCTARICHALVWTMIGGVLWYAGLLNPAALVSIITPEMIR